MCFPYQYFIIIFYDENLFSPKFLSCHRHPLYLKFTNSSVYSFLGLFIQLRDAYGEPLLYPTSGHNTYILSTCRYCMGCKLLLHIPCLSESSHSVNSSSVYVSMLFAHFWLGGGGVGHRISFLHCNIAT